MEFVIGAISLVSLALNLLIYRRITASYPVGSVEEVELEPVIYCCCKVDEQKDPEPEPEIKSNSAQAVDPNAYVAWKNQREIPWSPPVKPPEPVIRTPNRGPLARPDGFV
jgi:hypothetical protein